ncbi:MAG: hypothetical protein GY832_30175 [Chloroflexi bacterium]|nr:hypothetical protein [Chloroflexota bacterium]
MAAAESRKPRTARPGDICVLLEPVGDEITKLRQLQMSLQSLYGGRLHERVHLTCQRFELQDEQGLSDIVQHLEINLATIRPFPLTANSLAQIKSQFWRTRLLRWRIRVTDDVRRFAQLVEEGLIAAGTSPHFSHASGWVPTLITALEAILKVDFEHRPTDTTFPQYLFTGRQVVLSRIAGRRQFEILKIIQLTEESHLTDAY